MSDTNTKRIDTGGPAFPRPASIDPTQGSLTDGDRVLDEQDGMTLRDHFAGLAMNGELASQDEDNQWPRDRFDKLAEYAYAMADAMLRARKAVTK